MFGMSASLVVDKRERQQPQHLNLGSSPSMDHHPTLQNPNPNPKPLPTRGLSAYYQTRSEHNAVVASDWLSQGDPPTPRGRPSTPPGGAPRRPLSVIDEFNYWRRKPDVAEAVAAVIALSSVVSSSKAITMAGLEVEIKAAADSLKSWDATSISLSAGCDLFMRYVMRTCALEHKDFDAAKLRLIECGEKFGDVSSKARRTIAMLSQEFIFDGCTILVHGYSRVVLEALKLAASNGKSFRVLCTEGRPDRTGLRFSKELAAVYVPVKVLIDSAVAYIMDEVDLVFVGADGLDESGGIINTMGTYQVALVAHSMNKPVYVAAESYKFARLYPLDQKDLEPAPRSIDFGVPIPSGVEVETSARDYTPPQYLTLLFTDLGILSPDAVSDELIQLYL